MFALEGKGGAIDQPGESGSILCVQRMMASVALVMQFISISLW